MYALMDIYSKIYYYIDMGITKIDEFKTIEENLALLREEGEEILHTYQVVCLDSFFNAPEVLQMSMSQSNLYIISQDAIEKLPHESFELDYTGAEPKFTMTANILNSRISIFEEARKLKAHHDGAAIGYFTITRENAVPADYLLVKLNRTTPVYQAWAVYKILHLLKTNRYNKDELLILNEMIAGNFGNVKLDFLKKVFIVFISYLLLRVLITFVTDITFIFTILDIIAYIGVGYLAYWSFKLQNENNLRFKKYYSTVRIKK